MLLEQVGRETEMAIDALLAEDELLCVDLDAEGRVPCCGPLDYGFRACDRLSERRSQREGLTTTRNERASE